MRLPHWFGYRVTQLQPDQLCLVGRNAAVPFVLALFGSMALLPLAVISYADSRIVAEPMTALPLLALLGLSIGGSIYTAKAVPIRRELVFSGGSVKLSDVYLVGRREQLLEYSALSTIEFSVSWPRKSLFKLTHISLVKKDGKALNLVHIDSPMYSWQGRAAYRSLKAFLSQRGLAHLLGAEPDFSYRSA